MNCATCHAELPADALFCPNCGAKPSAASPSAGAAPAGVRTFSGLSTVAPMRESRASVLDPGTMFAERYEVVRKLGEGGMGVVYVAKDTNTGEEIVLKLIHPDLVTGEEAVRRLMVEGLTARQIRHPYIVAVYDVSQWNGQPYFTMEFVRGGTLRSWMINHISAGTEVRLDTAVGLIRTMLAGLGEAHRMGVVHRDLKPENVLLAGDPDAGDFNLKILDFGIARAVDAPRSVSGGGAIGTPHYMAPEQITSAEVVGPTADIYSLSVMFYELLMEVLPQARWESVSRSRADVPAAIDAVIEKGLSARARSRFATVAEYGAAIDAAMGQVTPRPAPAPAPAPIPERAVVNPTPRPQPEPIAAPPAQASVLFGNIPPRMRLWVAVAAVVVVVAVLGSVIEDEGNADPISFDPQVQTGMMNAIDDGDNEPPAAPVTGFDASGRWRDQAGNVFEVEHEGSGFAGTAFVPGTGPVTIRGTLSGSRATVTITTGAGPIFQGNGSIGPGSGGTDVDFGSFLFHINH